MKSDGITEGRNLIMIIMIYEWYLYNDFQPHHLNHYNHYLTSAGDFL